MTVRPSVSHVIGQKDNIPINSLFEWENIIVYFKIKLTVDFRALENFKPNGVPPLTSTSSRVLRREYTWRTRMERWGVVQLWVWCEDLLCRFPRPDDLTTVRTTNPVHESPFQSLCTREVVVQKRVLWTHLSRTEWVRFHSWDYRHLLTSLNRWPRSHEGTSWVVSVKSWTLLKGVTTTVTSCFWRFRSVTSVTFSKTPLLLSEPGQKNRK